MNCFQLKSQIPRQQNRFEQDKSTDSDLDGKIVILCQANNVIVSTSARVLSKHGVQLILIDIDHNQQKLRQLAQSCDQVAKHGSRWHFYDKKWQRVQKTLVYTIKSYSDVDTLKSIVSNVLSRFGKIDALVFASETFNLHNDCLNNPTLMHNLEQTFTNILYLFVNLVQLVAPILETTNGVILNISTVSALKPVTKNKNLENIQLNQISFKYRISIIYVNRWLEVQSKCLSNVLH